MRRLLHTAIGLHVLALCPLAAQQPQSWKVRGDTTGAPAGCSASAGIAAMNLFVDAMRNADSAGLTRAVARRFSFKECTTKMRWSSCYVLKDSSMLAIG